MGCLDVKMWKCESCFRIIELQMYNWKKGLLTIINTLKLISITNSNTECIILYALFCSDFFMLYLLSKRINNFFIYITCYMDAIQYVHVPLLWCVDSVVDVICFMCVCVWVYWLNFLFLGKLIQLCILWSIYMNLCWIIRLSKSNFVPYLISFLSFCFNNT